MCGAVGRIAGPDKARITEFPHTRFLGDILPPIHVLLVTIGVDAVSPVLECCFGFQPKINSTNIPLCIYGFHIYPDVNKDLQV